MTTNHPIPATRIPIDAPRPPERPDLYVAAYRKKAEWHVYGMLPTDDAARECAVRMQEKYGLTDVAIFLLPADPQPAAHPAPSDWRQACHVEQAKDGRWDVWDARRKYFLGGTSKPREWIVVDQDTAIYKGVFNSESDARAALSIAPVPPGVGQ